MPQSIMHVVCSARVYTAIAPTALQAAVKSEIPIDKALEGLVRCAVERWFVSDMLWEKIVENFVELPWIQVFLKLVAIIRLPGTTSCMCGALQGRYIVP
jgi:hypothetical protein